MIPAAQAVAAPRRTQHLLFAVGDIRCSLELTRIGSVVPWAALAPAEEDGVLGWLNLRGERIPVFDLQQQVLGDSTPRTLGSRILLVNCNGRTVGALASEVFAIATDEDLAEGDVECLDPCEVLAALVARLP